MEQPLLDSQELDAIRQAMREANPATEAKEAAQVTPVALISDDRAAERARPSGIELANVWAPAARKRLQRVAGAKLELHVAGVETVDGASLRDELQTAWCTSLEVPGRAGLAMVAVSGSMIEVLAARLLGASSEEVSTARPPSSTAIRVFSPIGEGIAKALAEVWREEQGCAVRVHHDPQRAEATRRKLTETDVVVVVTLSVVGPMSGTLRLVARPEVLVIPSVPVEAVPAPPGAIEAALGAVPIEVRVELGRLRMTMSQFKALKPGQVITLARFVDDPLPVECAGIIKARGRAIIARGALAVEIAERVSE